MLVHSSAGTFHGRKDAGMETHLVTFKFSRAWVRKCLFTILFLWSATAASVQAQETGSLVNKYKPAQLKSAGGQAAARAALEDYAACQVGRQPTRLAKLLTIRVDTDEYLKLMNSFLGIDACISSGTLVVTTNTHRGALFQALYNRQFKTTAPLEFSDVQSGYREIYPEQPSAEALGSIALVSFGECVTKADPRTVRDLMLSSTGAASEDMAFIKLQPNLNACMPQGKQLAFSKSILKGILAEAIYRLSMAVISPKMAK